MAHYDSLIRGGTVIDGTGIPRFRADLALYAAKKEGKDRVILAAA